jgi:type IV pilus secretin PilQ/predicted competence protein
MNLSRTGRVDRLALGACLTLFLAAGTTLQARQSTTTSGQSSGSSTPATTGGSTTTTTTNSETRQVSKPGTYTKAGAANQTSAAQSPATPTASNPMQVTPPMPRYPEDVPVYDQATPASDADETPPDITVSEYQTVDMFVQDEDLANVLQMLSLQSHRNIVASKDVSARVTANLYGVTLYEALDSILHVNGYGYVEKNNFIYVYTLDELAQIQAQDRQIVSKVISLSYLNANDAAEFVSPLLSDKGQIKTNGDVGSFSIPTDTPTGDEQFALASTLVVFDYPEHVAEVEKLIINLDTKPAQVLVEATILQATLSESNAFGVDFAFLNGVNMTDFLGLGGLLGSSGVLNSGADFTPPDGRGSAAVSTPGNTAGPGTFKLSILHDDIGVFIRALDEVSDVSIVSNPKVLALNRQSAKVQVGRKIGYLKSTTNNNTTDQSVAFLPTGTSLAFRPFISKDGLIRMELKPKVSEGIVNEFTDSAGRTVTVPDEVSQEITTNVIVPDGSTIVLGGLFREQTSLSRSQVPGLGDIPLIGAAFRGHDDSTKRSEVIFMIKPTIMNDQNLLSQGEKAVEVTEQVRAGSRQGLLPWSREKQTSQLNVRAEKLAAEGKKGEALYALRRSLELSPAQPDVHRMQEQLTGKTDRWPHRSMLETIVGSEAAARASAMPPAEGSAAFVGPNPEASSEPLLAEFFSFIQNSSEKPAIPDSSANPTDIASSPTEE